MASRKSSGISPSWIFILGGIAVILFSGFKAAKEYAFTRFSVKSIGARIDKWLLEGIVLRLTMNIQNDGSVPIPIDRFQGVIKYGDIVLAPVTLTNPTTILTGQTTTVPFTVTISYAGLAQNIVTLIQSNSFISNLTIEGVVSAGGINVPFTKNIVSLG